MMTQVQIQEMTQTQVQQTSHIFPQAPSVVKIHPLPKKAEFFTYTLNDYLTISAWMPDGFEEVHQQTRSSPSRFYDNHCSDCERNCANFLNQYEDENGDIDWDEVPSGRDHCFVYQEGYSGQYCPEGYVMEDYNIDIKVSNMVFDIDLSIYRESLGRFYKTGDSAYLCAGYEEDGEINVTEVLMASNVFGSEDYPEGICWGNNQRPETLREIVTQYFSTPFNNDLTNINAFAENCDSIRNYVDYGAFDVDSKYTYICSGAEADTFLFLDAENDVTSFFTFLCAGFKPLEKTPHIMIVPAKEATIEKNGGRYQGYRTIPDDVGKRWFVSQEGLLIGQI